MDMSIATPSRNAIIETSISVVVVAVITMLSFVHDPVTTARVAAVEPAGIGLVVSIGFAVITRFDISINQTIAAAGSDTVR